MREIQPRATQEGGMRDRYRRSEETDRESERQGEKCVVGTGVLATSGTVSLDGVCDVTEVFLMLPHRWLAASETGGAGGGGGGEEARG